MKEITDQKSLLYILSIGDCIVGLIMFSLCLIGINFLKKKYISLENKKLFLVAFLIKCFGGLSFVFYTKFVMAMDTLMYYSSILELSNTDLNSYFDFFFSFNKTFEDTDKLINIFTELRNYYMASPANGMIVRFGSLFAKILFGSYTGLTFIFSTVSFLGLWSLYIAALKLYPNIKQKLSLAILFLPSVLFWGSGLLKDSLTIGFLGFLTFASFEIFIHKSIKKRFIILLIFSGWMLFTIKSYIFYIYVVSFLFAAFSTTPIFNKLKYVFVVIAIFVLLKYTEVFMGGLMEEAMTQAEGYENIDAGSNISLFVFDFSPLGIVNMVLSSFVAIFFRPYLWESRFSLSLLLSSIESSFFLLFTIFTIYKCGILKIIKSINSDNRILFCFVFSVLFSIVVGFTTFNFGTMSRYKIPCLPVYLIMLFIIREKIDHTDKEIV
jgi:hypothetical protein